MGQHGGRVDGTEGSWLKPRLKDMNFGLNADSKLGMCRKFFFDAYRIKKLHECDLYPNVL